MELATLITECVKLTDDAHRANNAGHPQEAKKALDEMDDLLQDNADVFARVPVTTPESVEPPAEPSQPSDGDS